MGIKGKLRLISLLPLLLLFAISGYLAYEAYQDYNQTKIFKKRIELNNILDKVATQIAKERGMSAIYIGSRGKKIRQSLQRQRENVDKTIKELIGYLKSHPEFQSETKSYVRLLDTLSSIRKRVDSLNVDFKQVFFDQYSTIIRLLLNEIEKIQDITIDPVTVSLSIAYMDIVNSKEYSGQERGFISYILSKFTPMSDEDLKIWNKLIGKADSFTNISTLRDPHTKQKLESILNNEDTKEIFEDLYQARIEIQRSINDGLYPIDPTLWFNLNTEKIDILVQMKKILNSDLLANLTRISQEKLYILLISLAIWALSFILIIIGYGVAKGIYTNIRKLEEVLKKFASAKALQGEFQEQKELDLNTTEGINTAYELLELALKKAEDAKRYAEEASKAKSMFLANMSHEIRTPLNGIVGFTELLKNTELNDEQKEFVNIIEKSSENLLEIINAILDLSKIESNKIEIESVAFDPINEFENAVEVYAPQIAKKNIDFSVFIDPHLDKPLKGDPTKIKEVLINLISNAVKFTNPGGSITVEIRKLEESNNNAKVYFEVRDTGIGIPPDKKQQIFEAFSQADISVTRKYGGTGLGLTISSEFVKLMGGKLELESEEGKGSRFFFTLTLEQLPTTSPSLQNHFKGIKVAYLLKEDHPKDQDRFVKEYLEYLGCIFTSFKSIEELIQHKDKYNFAFVDYNYVKDGVNQLLTKKVPLSLIAQTTYGKKLESIAKYLIRLVYEPVNFTKTKEVLESYAKESKGTPATIQLDQIDTNKIKFKAKVLVAEDNEVNQKLIKRTLEDLGLQVDLANNGLEAFEKRRNGDYDIIFMDIQMPIMDGVEATHEILDYEEDEEIDHIPIVALTAHALKGDREKYLSEGMDEYITKPIVKEEIIAILSKFLANKAIVEDEQQKEAATPPQDLSSDTLEHNEEFQKSVLLAKKTLLESRLFKELTTSLGYSADIAQNFSELLDKAKNKPFGFIFIDKEIDGYDLKKLKELKQQVGENIKFILFADPENSPTQEEEYFFDEIMDNVISKEKLRNLFEKLQQSEKV